jgi:hypothetical protein
MDDTTAPPVISPVEPIPPHDGSGLPPPVSAPPVEPSVKSVHPNEIFDKVYNTFKEAHAAIDSGMADIHTMFHDFPTDDPMWKTIADRISNLEAALNTIEINMLAGK